MPLVKKYCCIFETIGEKRAITHLIQGVNMIIAPLIIVLRELIQPEDLIKLFASDRVYKGEIDPYPLFVE